MKLNPVLILFLSSFCLVSAQDKVSDLTENAKNKAAKLANLADTSEIPEKTDKFLLENTLAAPLPAGSARLDQMRARSRRLIEQKDAQVTLIKNGELSLFPHWQKAIPENEKLLSELSESLQSIASEKDSSKAEEMSKAVFAALQPLGFLLHDAEYIEGYKHILTSEEAAESHRLEERWDDMLNSEPDESKRLEIIGPSQLFTLIHLSVPIIVKAPPGATVVFRANDGGLFPNNLSIIETKASEKGIASTTWVSHGDSVADGVVTARSAEAHSTDRFHIRVVKLRLRPLPGMPTDSLPSQIDTPKTR